MSRTAERKSSERCFVSVLRSSTLSRRALLGRAGAFAAGVVGGSSILSGGLSRAAQGAVSPTPKAGGVLRVAISDGGANDVLDPRIQTNNFEPICIGMVYESLVVNDNGFQSHPKLATSWEASKDAKTWTFHLRRGVEFHDGSKLTAKDVLYSINLQTNPNQGGGSSGSPWAKTLGPIVQELKAVDDYTVQFTLNTPTVFLPLTLGTRYGRIVKDMATDFSKPIGTGPFVFEAFSPGQTFSATRNPHYWQTGRPYLDKVVVTNIPEQASKLQALLANQVDLIDNIDFSLAGTVKGSPGHQTISLKDAVWWAVSMDPRKNPVFKDARVVKAIKLAVNRTELLNSVFAGFGSIAYDNVIPGSDPYFAHLPQPPHDVAAAKSLLREAGYANGLNLELTVAPLEGSIVNFAVAIKQQLAEAGIRADVKQVPAGTFWDQVWLHNPMYIPSWNRRHPDEILSLAFVSTGPWNETAFANPAVDAAVKAARSTIDLGKQKEAYGVCQKILAEQDSHLLPVYRDRIWGATNKLHDVQLNFVTFSDYTNSWMG